jgi:hypothetical protein
MYWHSTQFDGQRALLVKSARSSSEQLAVDRPFDRVSLAG